MKSKTWTLLTALTLFALLRAPAKLAAEDQHAHHADGYRVVNLGTLGGTTSGGSSINSRGWVTGFSNLTGDQTQHAALWRDGVKLDLGTLGGPNSGVEWLVHNDSGKIAGIAETSMLDPLGEIWSCGFFFPTFTGHACRGFVWQDEVMTPLPTLGGTNGYAAGMNNRGQIVGWAENTIHDPTCNAPQVLQFEAVVYGPKKDQIQQLPPLPGDPDGAATAINDKGQVVGISGICSNAVGGLSAAHAVLWENGTPTDIGNLGGRAWNTPTAINNRGQIVGFSDLHNDDPSHPNFHAFLWTKEDGIRDLGTLPGDFRSEASGINNRGQVVGVSIDARRNARAFLWQKGVMTDLNTLVPAGSLYLLYANDINERGEITGGAFDASTGETPGFLAIPAHGEDGGQAALPAVRIEGNPTQVILPDDVRRHLQRRLGFGALD